MENNALCVSLRPCRCALVQTLATFLFCIDRTTLPHSGVKQIFFTNKICGNKYSVVKPGLSRVAAALHNATDLRICIIAILM